MVETSVTTFHCNKSAEKSSQNFPFFYTHQYLFFFIFFRKYLDYFAFFTVTITVERNLLVSIFPMRRNSKARRPLSEVSYPLHSSAYCFVLFFVVAVVVCSCWFFCFVFGFLLQGQFDHESD